MVAPFDYTSAFGQQGPFGGLLQGIQAGAQLAQADEARALTAARMEQAQQQAAAQQAAMQQKAAEAAELAQLQGVPLPDMTQAQRLRLMQLSGSEVTRGYISRSLEQMTSEQRAGTARTSGSVAIALARSPDIGKQRLQQLADAEVDPQRKKGYQDIAKVAEINPLEAARMVHSMMMMTGDESFTKVGDAVTNYLKNSGSPLYPEAPRPLQTVGGAVFDPNTRQFMLPPRQSQLKTPEEEAQEIRIAREKRPLAAPRERDDKLVQATDPATGQTVFATTEEIRARGLVPPSGFQGLSPKAIQEREAAFPQARQAVSTVGNTMTLIEETVNRLLENQDGLNTITGLVAGRVPGITDAGRRAEADLNQLKNLAFVQGITELRSASKTGAGVGNVSNKEGDRFENLKASLERTQSRADLVNALRRLSSQAVTTRENMRTAFDDTYEYRQRGTGQATPSAPTPAAPAAPRRREIAPGVFVTER